MLILFSPVSLEEARVAVEVGCDVVDIKNPKEGSLGAQLPPVIQEIVSDLKHSGAAFSATLGDLPFKPGTAGLAARGAASFGLDYVKAGLHGVSTYEDALELTQAVVGGVRTSNNTTKIVVSGYADYRRFGGLSYQDTVRAGRDGGAAVAMLDTAIKDGQSLFDAMSLAEIQEFTDMAREAKLIAALAGSLQPEHLEDLCSIGPDIIGVRGALCDNSDRSNGIDRERAKDFMARANSACAQQVAAKD
jgi:uncharacterized protein (UPF0264 family)